MARDPELEVKHITKPGQNVNHLVLMTCKHVDDIKLGGERLEIKELKRRLEAAFGALTIREEEFTNTGVHHFHSKGGTMKTDQDSYLAGIETIPAEHTSGRDAEEDATTKAISEFRSAVGAMGYALVTQYHLAVYVVSLQRVLATPKVFHLRRANALIRHAQKYPQKLIYPAMKCSRQMMWFGDSSFCNEGDKVYGLRGSIALRLGTDINGVVRCHCLESASKSHRRVIRNVFIAETFASIDTADDAQSLGLCLHQITFGPINAEATWLMTETGGLGFESTLVTDSYSLFLSISAIVLREPTERGLAPHLL